MEERPGRASSRWFLLAVLAVACCCVHAAADAKGRPTRGTTAFTETRATAKARLKHKHTPTIVIEGALPESLFVTEANPCAGTHCMKRAECVLSEYGVPYCRCKRGYKGNGFICTELNPCLSDFNPCGVHGYCMHPKHGEGAPGTYTCECAENYIFDDKTCVAKEDPCVSAPCGQFGSCTTGPNTNTYTCDCLTGYTFDSKTCIDIDPCYNNPCEHGICRGLSLERRPGGPEYDCSCEKGWQFDGTTCQPDPCASNPCANHEHSFCQVLAKGGWDCFCDEGYARAENTKCETESLIKLTS